MNGKIIKIISNDYTVSSMGKEYICKSRGKFRNMKVTPLVGDNVYFDVEKKYIIDVLPRKNSLVRPSVANIDQAVVVTSIKEPDFSSNLLDKLLVNIEFNNIKPIICFTKIDLATYDDIKEYAEYYKQIGYPVYFNNDIESIKPIFKDKITVFTGQSGSGKSSLLNKLDIDLDLKVDVISKALGRGKHTTRHVELIRVLDGLIADTPGFSALDFNEMTNQDIRDNFIEFNKYRDNCEYSDCMHDKEINCAIKKALNDNLILKSRYQNYIKFISR